MFSGRYILITRDYAWIQSLGWIFFSLFIFINVGISFRKPSNGSTRFFYREHTLTERITIRPLNGFYFMSLDFRSRLMMRIWGENLAPCLKNEFRSVLVSPVRVSSSEWGWVCVMQWESPITKTWRLWLECSVKTMDGSLVTFTLYLLSERESSIVDSLPHLLFRLSRKVISISDVEDTIRDLHY